jgi:hypothetical protein
MNSKAKWTGIGVLGLAAAQLIPVPRNNPQIETEVPVSIELEAVMRRSCFDCHSNETVWPWYSRVAPVSWLLAHDVYEGREHVNYSTWNRLSAEEQAKAIEESWEHVEEGDMAPWYYEMMHERARLSDADLALFRGWAETARAAAARTHPVALTTEAPAR